MAEYFVIDRSTLRPHDVARKTTSEPDRHLQEKALRDYFTQLAKREKVEDKIKIGATTAIGTAAPMLRLSTDEETAQQLQAASKGRLSLAKVGYR